WLAALGGADNLRCLEARASTRLRVELADITRLDDQALAALGCQGIQAVGEGVRHLVVGDRAAPLAHALNAGG
ncbi:PTS N-acetyl-D-glucosamine transporter, partial [Halomonas nitroreducens]